MDSYHVLAKCVSLDNIENKFCTEMMGYISCTSHCLQGEVNNVENNPGPAVFDYTNPTTSVSAGHKSRN